MTFRSYLSGLVIAGLVGMTAAACGDKGDDNDNVGLGGGRTGGTGGTSSGGSTTGGARTGGTTGEGGEEPGETGGTTSGGSGGTRPTTGGAGGETPTETGGAGGETPTETGGAGGETPTETGGAGGETPTETGGAGGETPTETGGAGGETPTETGGAGGAVPTGGAGGAATTGGAGGETPTETGGAGGETPTETGGAGGEAQTGGAGGEGTAGATGEGGAGGATGETTVTITDFEDTTVLEGGEEPLDGEVSLGADLDDNAGEPGEPETLFLLQPAAGALDDLDGQTIESARLVLTYYTENVSGTDTADELEVFAVMEAWDPAAVTYDDLPEVYTEAIATIPGRAEGDPWADGEEYSIDVTELVQGWIGAGVSFGIMVRNTGTDGADFYSADADEHQPRLEIVIAP